MVHSGKTQMHTTCHNENTNDAHDEHATVSTYLFVSTLGDEDMPTRLEQRIQILRSRIQISKR